MKQVIFFITILTCLISCAVDISDKETKHLAIAKKYMNAVENKNIAMMDSLLAENYMGYGPSVGDSVNKKEALDLFKRNVESLYESFQYTRHKNLAVTVNTGETKGDWVLNWAYLTIKYKDGRGPVNLWVNAVYRIENEKIVHSRTFYNEADVLRQLGYSFQPPME
jgi:limonene-1,2-epoxide hydrolase